MLRLASPKRKKARRALRQTHTSPDRRVQVCRFCHSGWRTGLALRLALAALAAAIKKAALAAPTFSLFSSPHPFGAGCDSTAVQPPRQPQTDLFFAGFAGLVVAAPLIQASIFGIAAGQGKGRQHGKNTHHVTHFKQSFSKSFSKTQTLRPIETQACGPGDRTKRASHPSGSFYGCFSFRQCL